MFEIHWNNRCEVKTHIHVPNSDYTFADSTYLCLAVLNGVLCVIFLHGRSSPQASPSATPCLQKSLSFEAPPLEEVQERMLAPMHYARSGLGTAALNDQLVAAGWWT